MVNERSRSYHQTFERNNSDRIRKEDDNAVMAVKKRIDEAFLTAIDVVDTPKIEITVRYNSGSSSRRRKGAVHKHDQRDSLGNAENTPLMTACRRLDLNNDEERNIDTGKVENFEYSTFPAKTLSFDGNHTFFTWGKNISPSKTVSLNFS